MSKGTVSINAENIMPVIKQWLYSDKDIFMRELISNGCDAISKYRWLVSNGQAELDESPERIDVIADKEKGTLTFIDNGIGMTEEEIVKYIAQVAFSGATDFITKYTEESKGEGAGIIGHFGLGFYSAFMVSDKVVIDSKSYTDAPAVRWTSEDGMEYEIEPSDRAERGTAITLYIDEEDKDFLNLWTLRQTLEKHCAFMPVPIFVSEVKKPEEPKEGEEAKEAEAPEEPKPINDTHPLWMKRPNECTDEEYKEFYRKVFNDFEEPLFWIHLNAEYPFNLKGILYFPRIKNEFTASEGVIKLYNNQVFVADNIKEVIPEFLLLLKGVIDCPDLPLNVSRSALQNDGFVNRISDYITKKVADKLTGMYKTEKEDYEKYWDDISPFIKFGCIRDEKFAEKMDEYVLYKNIDDKYMTLEECLEENKDKHENTVFYVSGRHVQGQYINMFRKAKLDAVYLEQIIDTAFIQHVEQKNEGVHFIRVDADLDKVFTKRTSKADQAVLDEKAEAIQEKLRKATGSEKLIVKVQNLKNAQTASVLTVPEEAKRMEDWMRQMGMTENLGQIKDPGTLVLNANNDLVKYVLDNPEGENTEMVTEQLLDLAKLANAPLSTEEMTKFIERSNAIMLLLANK